MEISQINSGNSDIYKLAQSESLEDVDKAERTNTEQSQSEGVTNTTNGEDRVEISKEAQALAQQNYSKQEDNAETESDPVSSQIEATNINTVV